MRWPRKPRLPSLAALCMLCMASGAHAQGECLEATPELETTPGSQASDVALDAPIMARFREPVLPQVVASGTLRLFEDREQEPEADAGVPEDAEGAVPGQLQRLSAHVLAFVPDDDLMPRTRYRVVLEIPGAAREREFLFETGRRRDEQRPEVFFDEDDVELASAEADADCELPEGAYLVDLKVPPAVDDADNGALEYYLYLTRAKGLSAPRLLARARRQGSAAGVVFRFFLTAEQAEEPVCTSLRVVDAVGKMAEAEPELCFDPRQGTYFQPLCSLSGRATSQARPPLAVPLGFLITWLFVRGWRGRRA